MFKCPDIDTCNKWVYCLCKLTLLPCDIKWKSEWGEEIQVPYKLIEHWEKIRNQKESPIIMEIKKINFVGYYI